MLCASKQFLIHFSFIYLPILLPNVDSFVVNPEQAAQAGKVGEGRPVPSEDKVALGQYDVQLFIVTPPPPPPPTCDITLRQYGVPRPTYLYPVRMAGETQWEGASPAFISLHPVPFSLTDLDPVNSSSLVIPLQAPHMTDSPGSLHRPT